MTVENIHERTLLADPAEAGALIDSLASRTDRLWPRQTWPRMAFDGPLAVGARGGHGPVRYDVTAYEPARSVTFGFRGPKGFDGQHGFDVESLSDGSVLLRHTLRMTTRGMARLTWPFVFRPLHDALIEDALSNACRSVGQPPQIRRWPIRVRLLRWVLTGGKAPAQVR